MREREREREMNYNLTRAYNLDVTYLISLVSLFVMTKVFLCGGISP